MAAATTMAVVGAATAALGTGYSIYSGERAADAAKKARQRAEAEAAEKFKRDKAKIAAQEQLIEGKRKKQQAAAEERKKRLSTKELLSGGEEGIVSDTQRSLLK